MVMLLSKFALHLGILVLLCFTRISVADEFGAGSEKAESFFGRGSHTNNWAVLVGQQSYLTMILTVLQVGTSRFWFNYRHIANVLSVYRTVKRLGIPDRYQNR